MIRIIASARAHTQTFILRHFKHTHYAAYLRKIRNSHAGQCCFVIGNGPSLTAEDLTAIKAAGADSFAMNRIYKIFSQTEWRPTYYVNTDSVLIRDCISEVEATMPDTKKFIPLQNKYYLGGKVKGAHYFFRNDRREHDQPEGFSLDCTEQVNIRGTVTIDCIQLAVHMGYRKIYLLGIDHNFDKIITEDGEIVVDASAKNYFCEDYDTDISNEVVHDLGITTRAYLELEGFCRKKGIDVYNASRETKLNVFRRISFEEALKKIEQQ